MRKLALIYILCLLLPLGACSKEPVSVTKPRAKQAKTVTAEDQKKQPAVETEDIIQNKFYAYNPQDKRDPFLPLVKTTKKTSKKKGASPIESFSVEEIKLLAIASDKDESYAMIELPNKKTFTIKEGTTLGLEGGKVEEISVDKVVIREDVKDYRGNLKPKYTVLKLHKGEE
jgi:Tfp pilus assembly protein PilP